ncbi:MAG: PQQ-dependent sugar dehydrogenase [Thermomicrobiales bacterium]
MQRTLWKHAVVMMILALLIVPFQAVASDIDPGGSSGGRDLAFSPAGVGMEMVEVASDFEQPIHVTNAGDGSGRLFVSGRTGLVWIIENGQVLPDPFLDITDIVRDDDGEQGFFAIEFHPDFASNGYFYAVYTKEPAGANVLARFQVSESDPNRADPDSLLEILALPDRVPSHNGGDLAFGPDGYLYYSPGDEGDGSIGRANAQDGQSFFGKMLRLDVDSAEPYAIPPDNPFVDDPDILDEIWSIGLRNPYRFSFDTETGDLYIGDVGQATWEEIDLEPAGSPGGLNYGWPLMEGFACFPEDVTECDTEGLTLPILAYSHLGGQGVRDGCTVTAGEVYRGEAYPFMEGAYLFADWCEGRIWSGYQDPDGNWQMTQLLDTFINWTDIGMDEAGELYGTDLTGGRLFRFTFSQELIPEISSLAPAGVQSGSPSIEIAVSGQGLAPTTEVLWDGTPLPTSYVSETEAVGSVAAAQLLETGAHTITVRNGPDAGESNSLTFAVSDGPFGDPAFESTWSRADELVAGGLVSRTWIWGPSPIAPARYEAYEESPDGERLVVYFDKSRMEITTPAADPDSIWYVTNGLLVVELMTGQMQVGNDAFVDRRPAEINVAGDSGDPQGVTYATLAGLRNAPSGEEGEAITTVLSSDGEVTEDSSLAEMDVVTGPLSMETGHRTASVFWDFMTSQGPVIEDGDVVQADLFENHYFATGFPITEAYWTTVQVGGNDHQVLLQCFERRCLTYTPANDSGWQVEAGNVGLHYHSWRYGE